MEFKKDGKTFVDKATAEQMVGKKIRHQYKNIKVKFYDVEILAPDYLAKRRKEDFVRKRRQGTVIGDIKDSRTKIIISLYLAGKTLKSIAEHEDVYSIDGGKLSKQRIHEIIQNFYRKKDKLF